MRSFTTQVVIVSDQATPNVLAVMDESIRPKEVILCATDQMRGKAEVLQAYFKRNQIAAWIFDLGNAYDFAQLQDKFLELAVKLAGRKAEVGVNLTGGTKLMTMAAQRVFWDDFSCFYINPERNAIQYISEKGTPEYQMKEQLKIRDFFAIHGYEVTHSEKKKVSDKTRALCRELLRNHQQYASALGTLNYLAGEAAKAKDLTVHNNIPEKSWNLLKLFQDHGYISYYDDLKIQFADEESRRFCQGFWLEDWVACALEELNRQLVLERQEKLQDYASSIRIKSQNDAENEIDAAFLYRNRLYLVECKTADLSEDVKIAPPLYKLDSLHQLPGFFTRMILVSYQALDSHGKQRAEDLRVEVVEPKNLLGLATVLKKMLQPEAR